ncbi:MAG: Holliday junction branch migration protein RuvA [Rhodothermales bacterium]|nr:Holliday junction branch migration protein RuvA [Rhodothermales bacterium]
MIAYVSGTLAEKKPTEAVIDVQGLGYRLLIPTSTFEGLPAAGQPVRLVTYQYVREDALQLFGFATAAERETFEVLIATSGVGPKLALAVLSAMRPAELRDHVLGGDASVLTSIPGVGRKTADRLIVELRDRLARLDLGSGAAPLTGGDAARAAARSDALAALEALGFSRAAAERSLRKVLRNHPGVQSAEELIRLSLREH